MPTNPNYNSNFPLVTIREIVLSHPGAIKIGPFGSQLKKEDLSREGYKVYGQENVIADDFSLGTRRIDATKFSALGSCRLFPGDLILTMMGTVGKCSIFPEEAEIGIMDSHLLRIQLSPEIANARFIAMVVAAEEVVGRQIERLSHGSIMSGLSSTIVQRFQVPLPPLSEQQHIAHIVDSLVTQIQQTEQFIAKLKQIKIGLLHDLLTRGIDENGDVRDPMAHPEGFKKILYGNLKIPVQWNIYPLEKVAKISSGVTLGRKLTGVDTIELPYLRVANVQDEYLNLTEMKHIRVPKHEVDRFLLQPGDMLMTEGGDFDKLGRGTLWTGEIPNCLHQNHIFKVRTDRRYLHPEFLALISRSSYGKHFFLLSSKQSTNLASINSTQLKAFPIPCPTKEEQERIVNILNAHDARITAQESHLAKFKQIKKGLMQDLLTGHVRVTQLMPESEQADIRSRSVFGCEG